MAKIEAKKLAQKVANAAKLKKAQKVVILDMRKVAAFCDYFVISSGNSLRQVNAIAHSIEEELSKDKIRSLSRISHNDESGWAVLDFVSVIAHVFYKPMREFYALESLWSDAKRIRVSNKDLK